MSAPDTSACEEDCAVLAANIERIYALPPGTLVSRSRTSPGIFVRPLLAHALRAKGYPFTAIGEAMGGRNHTSIMRMFKRPLEHVRQDAAKATAIERRAKADALYVEMMGGVQKTHAPLTRTQALASQYADPADEGRVRYKRCVEALQALPAGKQRYETWRVFCRREYPHTAKAAAKMLPREVRA